MAPAGSQGFPRKVRLGGNRNYRYVYRKGKSYPSRNLSLVYFKGRDVSRKAKVAKAVDARSFMDLFMELFR